MGMFGALSDQALGIMPGDGFKLGPRPTALDAPTRKPGFFGQGGVGRGILGIIGDALATSNGLQPVFMGMKMQQRQREMDLEDEQRKRQQALEDAIALTQAKAQFREPSELEQKVSYLNNLEPGLGGQYAHTFAAGPPMAIDVQHADGSVTREYMTRPPSSQGGGLPRVTDQASYDAVPAGAQYMTPDGQTRIKGGASQTGSRPFP